MKLRKAILVLSMMSITCFLNCGRIEGQKSAKNNPLHPYIAENKQYALYKPTDWNVKEHSQQDSYEITVSSPDALSKVDFCWVDSGGEEYNALDLLIDFKEDLNQSYKGVAFSEVYISSDSTRAVAAVRYQTGQGEVKGRYFFESQPKGAFMQGYSTLENRLTSERPLLLNIMASLAFSKAKAVTTPANHAGTFQPQFVQMPLVSRRAADQSLALKIPQDWKFLAGGGKVLTASPDGGMGFVFTSFSGNPILGRTMIDQGVIGTRYQPPAQTLATIFNGFGNRNVRILNSYPDQATNSQFQMQVGRQADTQDLMVSWISPQGIACLGAFKMINAAPSVTGLWFTIVAGMWGPEKDFYRYYPMLEEIGSSFSINDQYARQYIRAGLENLRRLQQQTMAAMQDLNHTREKNQADWEAKQAREDNMQSKWDDYRRGNSYWVSDLEGGKVYQTDSWGTRDTSTGDYYEGSGYNWTNFEGQNITHPSETMREISSYELDHRQ